MYSCIILYMLNYVYNITLCFIFLLYNIRFLVSKKQFLMSRSRYLYVVALILEKYNSLCYILIQRVSNLWSINLLCEFLLKVSRNPVTKEVRSFEDGDCGYQSFAYNCIF